MIVKQENVSLMSEVSFIPRHFCMNEQKMHRKAAALISNCIVTSFAPGMVLMTGHLGGMSNSLA